MPVDLHNFQPAARVTGLPLPEVFRDGALLAEAMLVAWREFGHFELAGKVARNSGK